jgi:hypothetical protein|tara:strand:+ start:388 stop:849 length:462 start_codon:yes stop_codon:yes gene_type:complete
MGQVNIDVLAPQKKIIDLDGAHNESLDNLITDDYVLDFIFDDILLIEFIDEVNDGAGDAVMRGGVYIPTNAIQRAWRKGKIILAGPEAKYAKKGDVVVFPNNLGVGISNTEIGGYGHLRKGIFLNESRLFGICNKKVKVNESKSRKSKKRSTK